MQELQEKKEQLNREFGLSSFAIDNRTSVFVLLIILFILGISAYNSMPRENFPEINIPTVFVTVPYPGNSPIDIENLIVRPIEKEINTISGVTKLTSTSQQDFGMIVAEFDFSTNVDQALLDVKDAVDKARQELPSDLDRDPNVMKMDFSEMPIMNVNISGDEFTADQLKDYAEYLEDRIEDLGEISKVDFVGILDKEVKIQIDKERMEALKISFTDVENAVARENSTISGGDILVDNLRRNIRITGEFKSMEEIGNVVIKHDDHLPVFLRDVANIQFDFVERDSYARTLGASVVTLQVKKRSGENVINAADKIKAIIAKVHGKQLPESLKIDITGDMSRVTKMQVSELENSIVSGMILVVLVLLFFLGLRNALFVGIAIPISMLMGVAILNFQGTTLNMMVLFSLILALGMLVDNGIVVVENVYRLMQEGYSGIKAAKLGVGEVAWPIISSTATTLAAFFPLLFWNDIMGEFMKFLPLTLIIVLSSSLFVALVINPVLTSVLMKIQDFGPVNKKKRLRNAIICAVFAVIGLGISFTGADFLGNLIFTFAILAIINMFVLNPASKSFQISFLPRLENGYYKVINWALKGATPYTLFGIMPVLMIFSIVLYSNSGSQTVLFPDNVPNYLNIMVEMPNGTDVEETNRQTLEVEDKVFNLLDKYMLPNHEVVESILTNIGTGTVDPNEQQGPAPNTTTPHKAKITVSFVEARYREGVNTNEILQEVRNELSTIVGPRITVNKEPVGPPVGPAINVEITGESFEILADLAEDIRAFINANNIDGIEELKIDLDKNKPEIIVDVHREVAGRYGLTTGQVAETIRTALFGKEVSKYKEGEDDYPIMIRLQDDYRYDLNALLNQKITFRDQAMRGEIIQIPISAIADIRYSSTFAQVKRKDKERAVTVFSNVLEGANAQAVNGAIGQLLEDYDMPDGYQINFGGEVEKQQESMAFLMNAFIIAVLLIFLIIISQFNRLTTPIIIMCSVAFSTIGVFLGYAIFKMDFVVIMTGIGIISLAGVVVNNAIVLIDYTDLTRKRKREELGIGEDEPLSKEVLIECIVESGKTRLRPVLLTAITTVLGLIPLAIGININFYTLIKDLDPQLFIGGDNVAFWGPMSWAVIFGLTFATFLTLVVVPVMYMLFDLAKNKIKAAFA